MSVRFYSYDERPELEERRAPSLEIWPAFMLESEVSNRCWGLLYERFGAFQHFLYDEDADEVVAEVNSVPVRVDLDDLPDRGWEDVLERGTAAVEEPTAVTAIAVAIRPSRLGQGLSRLCLERMRAIAGEHDFDHLVAPVRPSWKPRYPLVPIDRYIGWTTVDGTALRPVAADARATRRRDRPPLRRVDDDPGYGRGLGALGGHVVPGERRLRRPRRADARGHRPRGRSWHLRRAERLDAAPALGSRQREADPGAAALALLRPDASALRLDEAAGDRKPEPGAA